MSRCRACNKPLEQSTLCMTNGHTGLPEDMCVTCRQASTQEYSVMFDHDYEGQMTSENLSVNNSGNYYYDWYD